MVDMGAFLLANGRWNRPGVYGCLYTSCSPTGSVAEYHKMLAREGKRAEQDARRDLITIEVIVEPVLDLTDAAVRARYDVSPAELTGDSADDLETCRALADLARSEGYRAILSPSAALRDGVNVNIYLEGPASRLSLRKGKVRVPLNY